ncbi:ABC transporter ATP-binding protein [Candidatus Poriferisodalis sp.]|uniref:ABC transporter ATP-binding protein n=1 Tax=Candidatus Poriferisodalis sp. TaxID=3101277 RepID=UPI003B014638
MANGAGGGTLRIRDAHVAFDGTAALDGVDLEVGDGEMLVLLGPSGCGKTTLLRAASGLQPLDAGRVELDGRDLTGQRPDQRGIGLMFQDEVLFPHYDVAGNVAFGLRMAKVPTAQRQRRVAEMLELVGLAGFEGRDVATLSGGEAQRVSLARALAPEPRVLLLDEPFGSLDRLLRERLINELRPVLDQVGVTAVHVTHDHHEAFALADRIAVMASGRLLRIGTPEQVWTDPRTAQVARFLGHTNVLDRAVFDKAVFDKTVFDLAVFDRAAFDLAVSQVDAPSMPATAARHEQRFVLRSDRIEVETAARVDDGGVSSIREGAAAQFGATVSRRRFRGDRYELRLEADLGGVRTTLDALTPHAPALGASVIARFGASAVIPLAD